MASRLEIARSQNGNIIQFLQPTVATKRPLSVEERLNTLFLEAINLLNDQCPTDTRMHVCSMGEDENEYACDRCWRNYLLFIRNGGTRDPYECERQLDE